MEYPKKLFGNFLKAAFLPAIVAVPLTVGFIMVNAGSQLDGQFPWDRIQIPLLAQIGSFSELLWLLMSIGVMWVGVFAVLEKAGVMAFGAQAIKRTGESLGRIALKAPLALPIIPGPGGGMTPLFMFKAMNPRVIEHGISGKQGIKGYLDELNNKHGGTTPASRRADNALAAEKMSEAKLDKLHDDLEKLNALLKEKPHATEEELKPILDEIRSSGVKMDLNDFKNDMDGIMEGLRRNKSADSKKFETTNDEIQNSLKVRATPTPGGTVPPSGPPPTPPSGAPPSGGTT